LKLISVVCFLKKLIFLAEIEVKSTTFFGLIDGLE